MAGGGIYIKWNNQLWQEQPDGTYLVWDEDQRVWKHSAKQPPSEGGVVATKECQGCGRRIKATFRSCPYCGHAFEVAPERRPIRPEVARLKKKPKRSRNQVEIPFSVAAIAMIALLAVGFYGYVRYSNTRSCAKWRQAIRTATDVSIQIEPARAYEQLLERNEDLYAATRPEGCE
jgi:hypothetical protein